MKDIFDLLYGSKIVLGSGNDSKPKKSLSDYGFQKSIKKTSFSSIDLMKSYSEDDSLYVIKELLNENKTSEREKEINREKAIIREELLPITHPNLVKYYEEIEDSGHSYFLIEYCNKGDLWSFIIEHYKQKIPISQEIIINILSQILHGLDCLHSKGIIHRDIVPENILLSGDKDNLKAKISDFRLSAYYGRCKEGERKYLFTNDESVGKPDYVCPEILYRKEYDFSCDIFALGLIIFQMMTFDLPFRTKYDKEHEKWKREASGVKIDETKYSRKLIELISRMTNESPDKRPKAIEAYFLLLNIV